MNPVKVIGAGLAGAEATWQLISRGIPVQLWEMRPEHLTPAHKTGQFAELVCSNSLRGASLENAVGLLKEEMRLFNSLIMKAALQTEVPAGGALAVNREQFADYVTDTLSNHPLVEIKRSEIVDIPDGLTIIATGPLTSPTLSKAILNLIGRDYFYFYDAAAPIVTADSLDHSTAFPASRYDKGEGVYLNCPFTKEEYQQFWNDLVLAQVAEGHLPSERRIFFEGCMPIEVLASRGIDTMRYGPMKPVGINDPKTGKWPYAIVQLRPEDQENSLYNLVGFQTHLQWGEQQRVFRKIPGLQNAEFVRYGVMHRNTYLNAPVVLNTTFQSKLRNDLFFAGQMTGVEGYVESSASGLLAGINCAQLAMGKPLIEFPPETAIGALANYICNADPKYFQPMNVNYGLFPPLSEVIRGKKEKRMALADRSLLKIRELNLI
ncbi:MAG TPA: methylenetetrahydrofolate--tRNA-(uracil(54)-C(5))-methyltransferase (FADH(2)-oxidizing) TrmFO [Firmicutes bacterium]|nr:methylenetetrahydrofolate--tRNA-(uracil(54)-C(5))-methyltransferase (FADH(2)-oxidizing) TrmFO [Bacillota bacterium]